MIKTYTLIKEGSWIVIGQCATVVGSLILVRVLTEKLDPTQYGQLALGLTVGSLVNQVVTGGIIAGIGRFFSIASEKEDLSGYFYASWRLMLISTVAVVTIGVVLIFGLFVSGYSQWGELAALALIFSVISGYSASLSNIQNAARQRIIVAFHSALDAWLKIPLVLGILLWMGKTSEAVVTGYVISSCMVTSSQFLFLQRLIPKRDRRRRSTTIWLRQIWYYSWPFSTWGIFTWAQLSSDRWALQAFQTAHDVGLYSVLVQLGYTPIMIASTIVISFLGPILYQRSGDATDSHRNATVHQLTWRITLICLLITIVGFVFVLILHSWIFKLLVAPKYQSVSYLLPWMVLAGGFFAAGQTLALKLMTDMKPALMLKTKIITAIVGVLFNFYFTSVAGLEGTVSASMAFSILYCGSMVLLTYRMPIRRISESENLLPA
jgi:O-antigen/teichoic acid export membrane protein